MTRFFIYFAYDVARAMLMHKNNDESTYSLLITSKLKTAAPAIFTSN